MEKQKHTKLQDEGRLAYMIAWRDKRIAELEQLLTVHEQANGIYAAYIAYLLARCKQQEDTLSISKQEIRAVCGKYTVQAEDAGEDFIIRLCETGEHDGARRSEMAQA